MVNNMKRKIWYGAIVILIPLAIFIYVVVSFLDADNRYNIEEFEKEKAAFECVVEYAIDLYNEFGKANLYIQVGRNEDGIALHRAGEESNELEIDNELKENLLRVKETFGDSGWNNLYVTKQGVTFSMEGNNYAFIYTFDGKSPDYMNDPEEWFDISSRSLDDGWYYVTSKH